MIFWIYFENDFINFHSKEKDYVILFKKITLLFKNILWFYLEKVFLPFLFGILFYKSYFKNVFLLFLFEKCDFTNLF